jgi:UPF0716 family protein affecting phage T7 exclusion
MKKISMLLIIALLIILTGCAGARLTTTLGANITNQYSKAADKGILAAADSKGLAVCIRHY